MVQTMLLGSYLLCTQMERVRGYNDELVETIYVFDIVQLRRERSDVFNGRCTPPCRQRVSWFEIQKWWGFHSDESPCFCGSDLQTGSQVLHV